MSMLELVLLVAVSGLVVILGSSKMKEGRTKSNPSVEKVTKKASKRSTKVDEESQIPWIPIARDRDAEEKRISKTDPSEEDGASIEGMVRIQERAIRKGKERRRVNPLPRLSHGFAKVRSGARTNGLTSRGRPSGKTTVRSKQDGVADKRVSSKGSQ